MLLFFQNAHNITTQLGRRPHVEVFFRDVNDVQDDFRSAHDAQKIDEEARNAKEKDTESVAKNR